MEGKQTGHSRRLAFLRPLAGCLLIALTISSGCKTLQERTSRSLPFAPSESKEDLTTPAQMAVIWKDAVYTQPGKPPTRGFGGRFYFYNEQSEPIEVDGQLTVFAFDDSEKNANRTDVPDRKFVFTEEMFDKHHSETELGHSYSVWVPWDAASGISKSISLVPVFKSASGKVVRGEHTLNVLPGKSPASTEDLVEHAEWPRRRDTERLSVRPVGYQQTSVPQAIPEAAAKKPQMKTTTIKLSPSLSRQLQLPRGGNASVSAPRTRPSSSEVERTADELISRLQTRYQRSSARPVRYNAGPTAASPTLAQLSTTRFTRPATAGFGAPGQIRSSSQAMAAPDRNLPGNSRIASARYVNNTYGTYGGAPSANPHNGNPQFGNTHYGNTHYGSAQERTAWNDNVQYDKSPRDVTQSDMNPGGEPRRSSNELPTRSDVYPQSYRPSSTTPVPTTRHEPRQPYDSMRSQFPQVTFGK